MNRIVALAAAAAMLAPAAIAQDADADAGAALFLDHCAACHGVEARGDGPVAGVMTIKPTDLTALAAGNEGIFPTERVVRRIDGRDPLVAHGSPMPVYGDFFEGDDTPIKTHTGQPILTSRAIADLVAYLMGVQS